MNNGSVIQNNNVQDSQMINGVKGLNNTLNSKQSSSFNYTTNMQDIVNQPGQFTIISPEDMALIAFSQCDETTATDTQNPLYTVAITSCQLYNAGISVQIIYKSFNDYIDSLLAYINKIEENYLTYLTDTANNSSGIVNQTLTQYKNKDKLITTSKKRLTAYKQFMLTPYNSICDLLIGANNQNTKKENKMQEYADFMLSNSSGDVMDPSQILKNATISSRLVNQIISENNKLRRVVEQLNTQIVAWNNFPNNLSSGIIAFSGTSGTQERRKPDNIVVTSIIENIATAFANSGGNQLKTQLYLKLSEQQTKLSKLRIRALKSKDIQPINATTLAKTVQERQAKRILPAQDFKQPRQKNINFPDNTSSISGSDQSSMDIDQTSTITGTTGTTGTTGMDFDQSMPINVSTKKLNQPPPKQPMKRKDVPLPTIQEASENYENKSAKRLVVEPNQQANQILDKINNNYRYKLNDTDLSILLSRNECYNDNIINRFLEQIVLASDGKFIFIDSLLITNCKTVTKTYTEDTIFVVNNSKRFHWIFCFFSSKTKKVFIYDSLTNSGIDSDILGTTNIKCIKKLFGVVEYINISLQLQTNNYDCGPFAIGAAIALLNKDEPETVTFNPSLYIIFACTRPAVPNPLAANIIAPPLAARLSVAITRLPDLPVGALANK